MVDPNTLLNAYQTARRDLLALRGPNGVWTGAAFQFRPFDRDRRQRLEPLRPRGGRRSEVARLPAVGRACRRVARPPSERRRRLGRHRPEPLEYRDDHARRRGHAARRRGRSSRPSRSSGPRTTSTRKAVLPALRRRYGKDKTFAVPILMNCALAEMVPWTEVCAAAVRTGLRAAQVLRLAATAGGQLCRAGARGRRSGPLLPPQAAQPDHLVAASSFGAEVARGARTNAAGQRRIPRGGAADELRRDGPGEHRPGGASGRPSRRAVSAFEFPRRRQLRRSTRTWRRGTRRWRSTRWRRPRATSARWAVSIGS